jgi:hypothetical protein
MASIDGPFGFKACANILKSTGKSAKNQHELRDEIQRASASCIYYHMFQYFLKGRMLEYTNDFAEWTGASLGDRALAEELSNIDPYDFTDLEDLRNELLKVLTSHLERHPEPKEPMPGNEFYFNETITLVFPIGVWARNLAEFSSAIRYVDAGSIYYHFYEARRRLGGSADDFSLWIEEFLLKKELAEKIRGIDPLMYSVEQVRTALSRTLEEEVRRDMEELPQ